MKMIIATDGSRFSEAAIEKSCKIVAKSQNAQVKIVSAYQADAPDDTFSLSAQYLKRFEQFKRGLHDQAEKNAEMAVAILRERFPRKHLEISVQITMGASDRVIIEAAKDWNADLIIVGSHGRTFWDRMKIGSVSDSVINHAGCSVLVVRESSLAVEL